MKVKQPVASNNPNLPPKKPSNDMANKKEVATSSSHLSLKNIKKPLPIELKKSNSASSSSISTLTKRPLSNNSKIVQSTDTSQLTSHRESNVNSNKDSLRLKPVSIVYTSVFKCKNELPLEALHFNYQQIFLPTTKSQLLIGQEIQSRRSRKKPLSFISNLEKNFLTSDRAFCATNSLRLKNYYTSSRHLISELFSLILSEEKSWNSKF